MYSYEKQGIIRIVCKLYFIFCLSKKCVGENQEYGAVLSGSLYFDYNSNGELSSYEDSNSKLQQDYQDINKDYDQDLKRIFHEILQESPPVQFVEPKAPQKEKNKIDFPDELKRGRVSRQAPFYTPASTYRPSAYPSKGGLHHNQGYPSPYGSQPQFQPNFAQGAQYPAFNPTPSSYPNYNNPSPYNPSQYPGVGPAHSNVYVNPYQKNNSSGGPQYHNPSARPPYHTDNSRYPSSPYNPSQRPPVPLNLPSGVKGHPTYPGYSHASNNSNLYNLGQGYPQPNQPTTNTNSTYNPNPPYPGNKIPSTYNYNPSQRPPQISPRNPSSYPHYGNNSFYSPSSPQYQTNNSTFRPENQLRNNFSLPGSQYPNNINTQYPNNNNNPQYPTNNNNTQYPTNNNNPQYPINYNTRNPQYPINTNNPQYPSNNNNPQYPSNNNFYPPSGPPNPNPLVTPNNSIYPNINGSPYSPNVNPQVPSQQPPLYNLTPGENGFYYPSKSNQTASYDPRKVPSHHFSYEGGY